jgi:cytoskeletal protein RodZ
MPTLGEELQQARLARKLTIKQVVLATRVRAHYLEAMEADDFSALPSAVQARGFLRLYAEFLGLDANRLIARQRDENLPQFTPPGTEETPPTPEPPAAAPEKESTPEAAVVEPPPPPPPAETFGEPKPLLASQKIFNEIGLSLRERRELISLTLEEIERHTHVRKHNLEIIEAGVFDELPSPVQTRGMLNAYASFLDMDTNAVLLRYAESLQARRLERQPPEPKKSNLGRKRFGLPDGLRHFISPDLIFGGGMVITLLALSIWGAIRILSNGNNAQGTPTAGPSISDVLLASPVATVQGVDQVIPTSVAELNTAVPTGDPALGTPTDTPVPTVASAVQVTVIVLERTFLRVLVDGEVKQDGRITPGAALTFDGNDRIEVLTGSGNAIQVIFNERDLGLLGSFGEVVDRVYTVNGVETPTPTPSPTPTITPKPSITPRPSPTARPTSTTRPSSTPRPTATSTP